MFYCPLKFFNCRRFSLEKRIQQADLPEDEQYQLVKELERKETEYMRLQRHKFSIDDFELLTIIGRGAFGEVSLKLEVRIVRLECF